MSLIWHRRAALNTPWTIERLGLSTLLDADPGHYIKSGVGLDGPNVASWLDKFGYPAAQATAAQQPAWTEADVQFNGRGSIGPFTGAIRLVTGPWAATQAQPFTEILAIRFPATLTNTARIMDNIAGDQNMQFGAANVAIMWADAGITSSAMTPNSTAIVFVEWSGASSKMYVNNFTTAKASGNPGPRGTISRVLGNHGSVAIGFGGKFALYARLARIMSAAERLDAGGRLAEKYGAVIA